MMKIDFEQAIERLNLLDLLRSFDPVVIGTPPLGIAVEGSDIDIACSSSNLDEFSRLVNTECGTFNNFHIRGTTLQNLASVIVQFTAFDWDFELFCQSIPTDQQWGVRHFRVEQRLLELSPDLRLKIIELKRAGSKTEPAFAQALGLAGDPYEAILELEYKDDAELTTLLANQ